MSPRTRGVVASCALVLLVAAGCGSDTVAIEGPDRTDVDTERSCRDLVAALPQTVAGQQRREVEPVDALGAGWGDPAIVLTCAVDDPDGFDRFSPCQEVDGVGWFVPDALYEDQSADVVITTIGIEPAVELRVPASLRPPADAMVDVAAAIKESLKRVQPCV